MPDSGPNIEDAVTQKFTQMDFSGGMRRNVDPSRLGESEYAFLTNGRVRYGRVRPVTLPLNMTSQVPAGNYQGVYGYGTFLLLFVSGRVYVRDYAANNNQFNLISSFRMDQDVANIFAAAVPASWRNLQRKLASTEQRDSEGNVTVEDVNGVSVVKLITDVAGNPSCLVCQDGVNQPQIIFANGDSRTTKTFAQWQNVIGTNNDEREYVPIGKQMLYYDSILYVASADGKELYRSVTGRPLDFVIAIDVDGNKLPNLQTGKEEASRLSFKVDFNNISCLASLPTISSIGDLNAAGFYVSTSQSSYIVNPNYADLIYGEPTFRKQTLFPTGPINNFAVTDILGDTALVDAAGIRSFNAVLQLTNEGKNSPIYDEIHDMFEGITQVYPSCYTFDDYSLFAVDTIYGAGIVVRDNLRQKFVSLDIYPEVSGYVKQFAEIKVAGIRKLFFITTGNQLFEYEGGTTTATCGLYVRELSVPEDSEIELLPKRARLVFEDVVSAGSVTVTDYVDRKAGLARSRNIATTLTQESNPIVPPYGASSQRTTKNVTVPFERSRRGNKAGMYITFSCDGNLSKVMLIADLRERAVSETEEGSVRNAVRE